MGKTRKCRLTADERNIHEKAVKLRKMTDKQLVEHFDSNKQQPEKDDYIVRKFIEDVSEVQGVGTTTITKIRRMAKEKGYVTAE